MFNRSCSFGLILAALFLTACGGGGGSGTDTQLLGDSGTDDTQPLTSSTESPSDGAATPSGTISLNWIAPAARRDGGAISLSEIASYTIYFGTSVGDYPYSIAVEDASTTSLDIPDLPTGTYYLVITATDRKGQESSYSSVATKETS